MSAALGDPRLRRGPEHPTVNGECVDFDQLFDDVFPALHRYCYHMAGDSDVAEDAAQEAFVRFYRHGVEGPPEALRVWLFRAATNVLRDRHRVRSNRERLLEENPVEPSGPSSPEETAVRNERVRAVRSVLETLPERDRQMLLMREEGFSYREVADAVGVKATSVGTLLARAQDRFQEAYLATVPGGSAPEESGE